MPVSTSASAVVYAALKDCGIRLVSALPETWLVHLIRMAEDDPDMTLVRVAKEKALTFEPLNPNAETVAAMKAARRGELVKVGKPDKLLRSLNAGG